MKRFLRKAVRWLAVLILVAVLAVGLHFVLTARRVINRMFIVENIGQEAFKIGNAIDAYERRTAKFPRQLSDLVPNELPALPTSEYVDRVEYVLELDPPVWTLYLHSSALGDRRIYFMRLNNVVTPEEEKRGAHGSGFPGVYVLSEDQ